MGSNAAVPWFRETELFTSGAEGYHTFRIPGLVVAGDGTILAFTEGRRDGHHDYHALYMLLKRSTDNGATWGPLQVLDGDGTRTHHNPTPVYDSDTGLVWLAYNIDADRFMVMSSADSGATWSEPTDVSDQVRRPGMTFYVAGPGHGIQLKDGTLVIPCDHHMGMRMDSIYSKSHVVMSTDHGKTWQLGGSLSGSTDECEVVETQDGSLYMAVRGQRNRGDNRYCAWSRDGGLTWSDIEMLTEIPDPHCQASITRFTSEESHGKNRILFSNVSSATRDHLTVRISYDECKTWTSPKIIYPGPAAYSELAVAADMSVLCLYERGIDGPYESIRMAQFNLEWLTDGEDTLG